MAGDRRQPAAAVDQDGHAPLGCELEHGRKPLVVEQEALGPRMQLDPACAEIEAAPRLLDGARGEVEAREGDEEPVRTLRGRERPVVRGSESGLPVGLVHAERERPADAVALEERDDFLVGRSEAVDVAADVDVGVEELDVLGQERSKLVVVGRDQAARAFESLVHGIESTPGG